MKTKLTPEQRLSRAISECETKIAAYAENPDMAALWRSRLDLAKLTYGGSDHA